MVLQKNLGEFLIEKGLISWEQLQKALSIQKPKQNLGQLLIKLGFISEDEFLSVLKNEFDEQKEPIKPINEKLNNNYLIDGRAPIIKLVDELIEEAIGRQASDIHIEPQEDRSLRVRFRIDGQLQEYTTLSKDVAPNFIARIKIMADIDITEKRIPQDGRTRVIFKNQEIDLRISSVPLIFGEKIVIRILDKEKRFINLEKLGLESEQFEEYKKMLRTTQGMILITGPTSSGKTTTLYASLKTINSLEKNIVTIEDPVEYVLEGINQMGVNQKTGLTFALGLRSILRQDPDVIMVGEIRDNETADIAIRAATTGQLVLSTLHTNDAAGALPRLINMGVEPFLVASAVIAVVSQRLVRKICPYCKEGYEVAKNSLERLLLGNVQDDLRLHRGKGCAECAGTGYKGRTAIFELLPIDEDIQYFVMQKMPSKEIKKQAIKKGMLTLRENGIRKVLNGSTTLDEVMRVIG
ncbi:GspE/PulE family protein [Bacillota bacterium LX-D]|nr:GspE/PulE family protein [Bacillota bacterium LX-D]